MSKDSPHTAAEIRDEIASALTHGLGAVAALAGGAVLITLTAAFVVLHLALRALAALFEMPLQARRWRALQRERATYAALIDATTQFGAGRYLRARKAATAKLMAQR